jgi:hypothetical protein
MGRYIPANRDYIGRKVFHSQIGFVQASAFRPTNVPGLVGWYRPDLGITIDGSSNLQGWADQSGNGFILGQSSASDRPAYFATGGPNNVPYVSFNGTTDYMNNGSLTELTAPFEYFVACRFLDTVSVGHNEYMIDFGAGNYYCTAQNSSNADQVYTYAGDLLYGNFTPATDIVIDVQAAGASTNIIFNSSSSYSGNAGSGTPQAVGLTLGNYGGGGNFYFHGYVYEVMIFNQIISSTNRNNLKNYFQGRYNI